MPEEKIQIQARSFQYALRAINLFQSLSESKNYAGNILGKQYLRSATSIGANIQEAQAGESRADFIHKMTIAQKEARECLYWLQLLQESKIIDHERLQPIIQETKEIIAIITTIIVNTKKNIKRN